MNAGYLLAVPATLMVATGFITLLVRFCRRPAPDLLLLLGFAGRLCVGRGMDDSPSPLLRARESLLCVAGFASFTRRAASGSGLPCQAQREPEGGAGRGAVAVGHDGLCRAVGLPRQGSKLTPPAA